MASIGGSASEDESTSVADVQSPAKGTKRKRR